MAGVGFENGYRFQLEIRLITNDSERTPAVGGFTLNTSDVPPPTWDMVETWAVTANAPANDVMIENWIGYVGAFNMAPTVVIDSPDNNASYLVGVGISFACTASDLENDALTYLWDLDDGENSTDDNFSYSYSNPGTYVISLVVNDGIDNSNQASVTINITTQPPSAAPGAAAPAAIEGILPQLEAVVDPANNILFVSPFSLLGFQVQYWMFIAGLGGQPVDRDGALLDEPLDERSGKPRESAVKVLVQAAAAQAAADLEPRFAGFVVEGDGPIAGIVVGLAALVHSGSIADGPGGVPHSPPSAGSAAGRGL